ncbi:MAG: YggS family pyridoxal phosphate-dependent enzyme [Prevotellaceae bacterium]|nr:YggS family pyridoxal phosphate-dependent enzyme [Prevotellaceae bacterium]
MYPVKEKLLEVKHTLREGIELVAVSKFHPKEYIEEAYALGHRVFGESREQELKQKHQELPQDIVWHFIGHLQTNKVKYIVPYVSMIETVDSIRLLREIEKQAAKVDRVIDVLLELHIADEETKSGMTLDEWRELLADGEWKEMSHIRIRGIMMMASNVDDDEQIRQEFNIAADFFDEVKAKYFADDDFFSERSYGMSGDYMIAQECRSTMVRIGTTIFGPRVY